LAVAAIAENGNLLNNSCYGDSLDLVATSSGYDTWTIDRMDSLGFNPDATYDGCPPNNNNVNYMCLAGQTSMAAPLVAGTAALLLSRRPDLTSEQVYDILRHSADTAWGEIVLTELPDFEYGYGRVNAYKALLSVCRGDVNNDGSINLTDYLWLNNYLYYQGAPPEPHVILGDVNCDGNINLLDLLYLIAYLYDEGAAPPVCFNYDDY
jgi:subtilisin family serine protease